MPSHPLLREIFERGESEPAPITLANLARSLDVPIGRIQPLVEQGYIKCQSKGELTSGSWLETPSEDALKWLRQWFQPVYAKPMFSQLDLAELLGVTSARVIEIAAMHDIPVVWDPALGHIYSMWSAKQLVIRVLSGRKEVGTRFDRQAFLWNLLEGDPLRAAAIPPYDELVESEIQRVAELPEPQRSLRSTALRDHFRESSIIATSGSLSSEPFRPGSPDDESSPSETRSLLQACEQVFSRQI